LPEIKAIPRGIINQLAYIFHPSLIKSCTKRAVIGIIHEENYTFLSERVNRVSLHAQDMMVLHTDFPVQH